MTRDLKRCNRHAIFTLLLLQIFFTPAHATELLSQPSTQTITASTAIITLNPTVPKRGQPFTVNISGVWQNRCIVEVDVLDSDAIRIEEFGEQRIDIFTGPGDRGPGDRPPDCRFEDPYDPTPYAFSVPVPADVWGSIDERQPLEIYYHDAWDFLNRSSWRRKIDLVWGLHEIPPRLGSGLWVSNATPRQGLMVQQQNETVVFYELKYNRQTGEPNWHYANAKFHGNAANGVAFLFNWMSPGDELLDPTPEIPYRHLVQPESEEMGVEADSAGIVVEGFNRIKVFVGKTKDIYPIANYYRRWVFAQGKQQLPVVVPDMSGAWNLYGFSGFGPTGSVQEFSYGIKFNSGTRLKIDLYRFLSINRKWRLDCTINLKGEGQCELSNTMLDLVMNFDLLDFNGNVARGALNNSAISDNPGWTGILLRSGFDLPEYGTQQSPIP